MLHTNVTRMHHFLTEMRSQCLLCTKFESKTPKTKWASACKTECLMLDGVSELQMKNCSILCRIIVFNAVNERVEQFNFKFVSFVSLCTKRYLVRTKPFYKWAPTVFCHCQWPSVLLIFNFFPGTVCSQCLIFSSLFFLLFTFIVMCVLLFCSHRCSCWFDNGNWKQSWCWRRSN